MYTPLHIYRAFKNASGRPYRVPKDWEEYLNTKMIAPNRKALITLCDFFNTKWRNINLDKYMECGFEVLKGLTYTKFFDKRIISLYITKDKVSKHNDTVSKKKIIASAKFLIDRKKELNYSNLVGYARLREGHESIAITDYIRGDIDSLMFYYLIDRHYLMMEDFDEDRIPWVMENQRELHAQVISILEFLQSVEDKINERID